MRAEQLSIVARPRTPWEATDLGFCMVRAWWRQIWGAWFLLVLPPGLALVVALRAHPFWALFLLWWLRPVFARVVLHVLGEALFAAPPSPLATARAVPRLLRSGLLTSLFIQRLSPARSYLLPVLQLEALRGDARRQRTRVLARRDVGAAAGMLAVGAHVNGALVTGLVVLCLWLGPDALIDQTFDLFTRWWEGDSSIAGALIAGLYLAGVTVVEPFLVAGGFGLYVNRRVWLEGWDVELAFRGLTRRVASGARVRGGNGLRAAIVAVLLLLGPLAEAVRAESNCNPGVIESAKVCAEEILSGPDFGTIRQVEIWAPRQWDADWDPELPDWLASLLKWLGNLFSGVSPGALEPLLWIGLAVGAVAIVVSLARQQLALGLRGGTEERRIPAQRFGLDLDPASLPDDLVGAARAAFSAGDAIGALSLLYRGALVLLIEHRDLEIADSDTEGDCLRLVSDLGEADLVQDFRVLTGAWIMARYGRASLAGDGFEDLCRRWRPRLSSSEA